MSLSTSGMSGRAIGSCDNANSVIFMYVSMYGIGSMRMVLYAIAVCYVVLIRCSVNEFEHLGHQRPGHWVLRKHEQF